MDRRRFLVSAATVTVPSAAGCISGVVGGGEGGPTLGEDYVPLTEHYHATTVVYNNEQLRLRAGDSPVPIGGTITFKITNTSPSSIGLGCHNPWTIQQRVDGEWRDVIWTAAEGFLLCVTGLPAGESTSVTVTLSKAALETQSRAVPLELRPGQYRFVLLSQTPYLAVNFRVRA
jgi:hypothetical protein